MATVLLMIQLFVSIALVVVVLLQKSDGGALGIGGGGGAGGLFSPRGAGDALSRTTAILGAAFFVTSMALTLLALHGRQQTSILDTGVPAGIQQPLKKGPLPAAPGQPLLPAIPGNPSPK